MFQVKIKSYKQGEFFNLTSKCIPNNQVQCDLHYNFELKYSAT